MNQTIETPVPPPMQLTTPVKLPMEDEEEEKHPTTKVSSDNKVPQKLQQKAS